MLCHLRSKHPQVADGHTSGGSEGGGLVILFSARQKDIDDTLVDMIIKDS